MEFPLIGKGRGSVIGDSIKPLFRFSKSTQNSWSGPKKDNCECTQDTWILQQLKIITWKDFQRHKIWLQNRRSYKQKSPVWNFLSDQQTRLDQVSKTRVRHPSWLSMNPGGGISRVSLYLSMICVYICPKCTSSVCCTSPPTATAVDVDEGKTKRHGWMALCDRPWPLQQAFLRRHPFIKIGPIYHL